MQTNLLGRTGPQRNTGRGGRMNKYEEWESAFTLLDKTIYRLRWRSFWMNDLAAWLYGGYRERWRGRGCPMDN